MTNIRINDLPLDPAPNAGDVVPVDGTSTRKTTLTALVDSGRPFASQSEAEAGTSPILGMSPLTTAQAIAAIGGATFASTAQGLPVGGSVGQVLGKTGAGDYAVDWTNAGAGDLIAINNLADVANAATALGNLGGLNATLAASTYLTQVAAASTYQPIGSYQPLAANLTSWGGITRAAGFDTFATGPTSANLKGLVTDETGSGALVFGTSPTLVTPALGTPSALVLTNATGLLIAGGGTGAATADAARLNLVLPTYAATRTAMKALDTTKDITAILTEAGRQGVFIWTAGDFSAQVAADTAEGIYVKATAIAANLGAWVRVFDGVWWASWFGVLPSATAANNVTAFNAMLTLAVLGNTSIRFPAGDYNFNANIAKSTAFFLSLQAEYGGVANLIWSNVTGGLDLTYTDAQKPITVEAMRFFTSANGGGNALKITAPNSASLTTVGVRLIGIYAHPVNPASNYWTNGIVLVNCWYPQIIRPDIKGKDNTFDMVNGIQLTDCQAPQVRDVGLFHSDRGIKADGAIHGEGVNISGGEMVGVNYGIDWAPSVFKPGITIHDLHINASARCIKKTNCGQFVIHDCLLYKTNVNQTNWEAIEAVNCAGFEIHSLMLSTPGVTIGTNDGIVLTDCTEPRVHDITGENWNGAGAIVILTGTTSDGNFHHLIRGRNAASLIPVNFVGHTGTGNQFDNIDDPTRRTLTANSATPSVANSVNGEYTTGNTGATAYTNFTGAIDGQRIAILVNDAFTTFNHVATLILKGGVNVAAPNGAIMKFRYEATGTRWREESRNF